MAAAGTVSGLVWVVWVSDDLTVTVSKGVFFFLFLSSLFSELQKLILISDNNFCI